MYSMAIEISELVKKVKGRGLQFRISTIKDKNGNVVHDKNEVTK